MASLLSRLAQRSPTEKQLERLGLQRNKIGVKGTSEMANALSLGCGLQTLDVRANFIRDEGAHALIQALKAKKCNLQCVDVEGSGISASVLAELHEVLELRKSGGLAGLGSLRLTSKDSSAKQSGRSDSSLPTRTLVAEILGRPPASSTFGAVTKRVAPGGMLL